MNIETLQLLYNYNWTTHRKIWQIITKLTEEQFTQNIDYAHDSIHGQVVHMMGAEWIWLSRLQGVSPTTLFRNEDYPMRPAIRARWDEIENDFRAYLATLNDDVLQEEFHYQTTSGKPFSNVRLHILLHVVNHGTDHRAQLLSMLHRLGAETIEQDLILYLREN